MRKINKRTKIKLVVMLSALAILLIMFKSTIFNVDILMYNLNQNVSEGDLFKASGIEKGVSNIFLVSTKDIENSLQSNPFIKSAKVKKVYPNKLNLDLEYREAYAVIKYSDMYIGIDDELRVLSVDMDMPDGFLIEGFVLEGFIVGEEIEVEHKVILREALNLIELLKNSHIEFKPVVAFQDNSLMIALNDSFKVKFGRGDNIERKFNDFVDIYENLKGKGISSGIIDVSSDGLPLYKPFGD